MLSHIVVECATTEFDGLVSGGHYVVTEVKTNSYLIQGKWYGSSNFRVI